MEQVKGPISVSVACLLSNLMYAFKYGMKDKYYKILESLKPVMDKNLYDWYWNFGQNSLWLKKGG